MKVLLSSLLLLGACLAIADGTNDESTEDSVERGRYLTKLLGCGGCHTQGALTGEDLLSEFAGSNVGMAYGQAVGSQTPAVVFPSNITPDVDTGIGAWTRKQIATAIKQGRGVHKEGVLAVMPWFSYSQLEDQDGLAIADYLKSIPAVTHQVPEPVNRGERSKYKFVRIGVYAYHPEASP